MFTGFLSPISTVSDFIESLEIKDEKTDDPIDLTGMTATLKVRRMGDGTATEIASTTNGRITFPQVGVMHIQVLNSDYAFKEGEWDATLYVSRDGFQSQIFLGNIYVRDGSLS